MKRIAKLAVAASILVAIGILGFWIVIGGGSPNIAFAEVAKALENLRTATFDETLETKDPTDGKTRTSSAKTLFLAPRQRCEMSMSTDSAKDKSSSIMIMDCQTGNGLSLVPEQKVAITFDGSKIKKPAGTPSNMFEMVRQLVREGSSGLGGKAEPLGKKEIDGRAVVGFRTHNNMVDMTLWADPQTARPVRIELNMPGYDVHSVMSNFRYDMELDPSLFSLEPPAGYTVQNMDLAMPVENDLVNFLRFVAEHNDGTFPAAIGPSNKEYQQAMQAEAMSETQKFMQEPETAKLLMELQAQYGKDRDGFMKAWMKAQMPFNQKLTQKIMLKHQQGTLFYGMLRPENDSHYVGGGVKLGTPDRPIFWYKPTGSDKYRVIYADLSVKEAAPAEIKDFPKASEGYTAQTMSIGASVQNEKDLIETLRVYAAAQNGLLPPTLDASDVESGIKAPMEKEIEAKYGTSREAKMKALQDVEFMMTHLDVGLVMKCGRALAFLHDLKPENDSHYAGKDVKLGTPDRPIFWYKPTGADNYRVIYADLSVKEMAPDDVKTLPEAKAK
jgi:outer membrane lipoprotein-sorting protein